MPEATISPEVFRTVSWNDAFAEGELRIRQKWVDALVKTPAENRMRLHAQRAAIQKKISQALEKNDSKKLRAAFRAQIRLLAHLSQINTHA
jgi:hypothetical protein